MLQHAQDNPLICLCRVVQKLHLDIQMGEHVIGHDTDKTKDKMETLENNLSHLVDQMKYITMQQEYQRVSVLLHCLQENEYHDMMVHVSIGMSTLSLI